MTDCTRPPANCRDVSPCKGCAGKHPACHDSCEAFAVWKRGLELVKDERRRYLAKPFSKIL